MQKFTINKAKAPLKGGKKAIAHLTGLDTAIDETYGFYSEPHFREMLTRERKRTERSRKPFYLALIDVEIFDKRVKLESREINPALVMQNLIHSLSDFTREIDIRGWYEQGRVLGIIYTEVKGLDGSTIMAKLRKHIHETVGPELGNMLEILMYRFPSISLPVDEPDQKEKKDETGNGKGGNTESESEVAVHAEDKFYPESDDKNICKRVSLTVKRAIDVFGSFAGILLFSPIFIVVPIIIKLTSKGPVFFRQNRVGQNGGIFTFVKFRSMRIDSDDRIHKEYVKNLIKGNVEDKGNGEVYKITDDPRVTPIGRFLRKTSLDELPQFFNVMVGDMSLVGPRPAIPYEIEEYDVWHRRRLFVTKPGITGIWQVEGRSATTFDGMVRMDLQYNRKWSLLLDLKLIIKTPLVLISAKGAY